MSRVINTNNPGKRRSYELRTIAEILRALGHKKEVDDEAKDMAATIIFCLRVVNETVEESIQAWEKRQYWKKADDFQEKWYWTTQVIAQIENVIRTETWNELPPIILRLLPRFADIEINKSMRSEKDWSGNYDKFLEEKPKDN
jgi:hypothetical protein